MILVFAKQNQMIKTLVEIMKSRGILEASDPAAYDSLVRSDLDANAQLFADAKQEYLTYAKRLGIVTGLEA
ncbi:MAG: hypothetical protein LAO78_19430 [Acidobacteriia bacterium]|nr:hypothetical protein [Terriglobia bacterium]